MAEMEDLKAAQSRPVTEPACEQAATEGAEVSAALVEQVARIIDPEAWRAFDLHQAGAKRYVGIGGPVADELADHLIAASHDVTEDSLTKARAILALSASPALPVGGDKQDNSATSSRSLPPVAGQRRGPLEGEG